MATTSICATGLSSSFHGNWGKSIAGEDYHVLARTVGTSHVRVPRPVRSQPMMGNVNEGKGIFAPLVIATRNIVGKKRFNQLRGKAIALHSQVTSYFGSSKTSFLRNIAVKFLNLLFIIHSKIIFHFIRFINKKKIYNYLGKS